SVLRPSEEAELAGLLNDQGVEAGERLLADVARLGPEHWAPYGCWLTHHCLPVLCPPAWQQINRRGLAPASQPFTEWGFGPAAPPDSLNCLNPFCWPGRLRRGPNDFVPRAPLGLLRGALPESELAQYERPDDWVGPLFAPMWAMIRAANV